jgi:tetratricopeptide (TPR) repeat protein
MPPDLPPALLSAIQEGRAVLFLGAGASRGACDANGSNIPDAKELSELITNEYLGDDYIGLDFRTTYDLACNQRDMRTVQKFVFDALNPYQPAPFHKLIPTFPWAGIATTNYDLIIERAYKASAEALQKLIPNTKDGDVASESLGDRGLLYVKLHGCLTRYSELEPPMVASTEQLIAFREGRQGQFATFLEWAKNKTIVFCGYSFLDSNLRTLFDEVIKEGDKRPKHYIANKGVRPAEKDYWRDRRVEAIDCTFQDFMEALDIAIPKANRTLGAIAAGADYKTSFTRFITTAGERESQELIRYLDTFIEHVGPDVQTPRDDPKRFFSGFDLGWYPISEEMDVRQPVVDQILRDHILPSPSGLPLVLIKGHAGSGKSVSLRRICYEAATKHARVCFYVSRQHMLQLERFEEIFRLTNLPVFLFVDNVAEHREKLIEVAQLARKLKVPFKAIITETYSNWNILCDDLEPLVREAAEMRYLSERNIELLLSKLEKYDCLGYLGNLPRDKRLHELQHVHGRQLLVALLEATHGVPLINLVASEYQAIPSADARLLYLDICALHRFGPPVRAGLISRIHNISFDEFKDRLFKPLEEIVVLRKDKRSGDYVYEARHSFIAHTVYEAVLNSPEKRFDSIVRITAKLNPNYSYDLEVASRLLRSEALRAAISDPVKIRQVYDVATTSLGERGFIFHQRGNFEMHVASSIGELNIAERYFEEAKRLEPYNRSVVHSLAELDLKRSRLATDPLEIAAWRNSARARASSLASKGTSPYPHHTLLKIAIDEIRDALETAETDDGEAAELKLGDCITNAETVLRRGLQQFPNEAILLSEEGELSKVLSQADRAEKAFAKSFEQNPRSSLIAKKLSRIKRARGHYLEAQKVLQKALEFNPGAQDLHYDYALAIIESAPDADQRNADDVLYHLRRSFAPGDRNYQAQFWYARQLTIMGKYEDARILFRDLNEGRIPFREKTQRRAPVKGGDGKNIEYTGVISNLRDTFGFVRCDALKLDAFFVFENLDQGYLEILQIGDAVRFNLTFTLRGPTATNIVV